MASGGRRTVEMTEAPAGSPKYLANAFKDVGVREYIMKNRKKESNPVVVAWAVSALGFKVDTIKTPWCAIWIGAKLEEDGYTSTKSAMARSYLKWGQAIDHGDDTKWKVGDIVIFWRGKFNDGVKGHIIFLVDWDDETVTGIGGNQGDRVTVEEFDRSKIIGVRRPRSLAGSRTMQALSTAALTKATETAASYSLPNPEEVTKVVDTARGPIEMLGTTKPWIIAVLGIISVVATLYAVWYRMRDFSSGRNA